MIDLSLEDVRSSGVEWNRWDGPRLGVKWKSMSHGWLSARALLAHVSKSSGSLRNHFEFEYGYHYVKDRGGVSGYGYSNRSSRRHVPIIPWNGASGLYE